MSHFTCPNSSLIQEANIYGYSPISDNAKENNKRCWICFGEEDDSEGRWVNPCQCSLVSHEQCLLDWIAENQKNTPLKKVSCPQCSSSYVLSEKASVPLVLMSIIDSLAHITAPYLTVLGLGCSILITSTTYGAYTVLTLFGAKEGEKLIGNPANWTWRTWIGLPSIPVALVMARSRWADHVLPAATLLLLRLTGITFPLKITWPPSPAVMFGLLPWIRLLYNSIYRLIQRRLSRAIQYSNNRRTLVTEDEINRGVNQDVEIMFGRRDANSNVVGALLWPTISSIVGSYLSYSKIIRKHFPETFQRNILGGCLFVIAKDFANLYYKYERIKRRRSRKVVNYSEIKRRSK